MSKKNTNNRISYGQYKAFDIFVFLLIMCVCEIINVLSATLWFSDSATFTISVMLLVSLVVIIRWGWLGIIFPIADGLLYCWLNGATVAQYVIYAAGNAFIILVWFLFKLLPKERIVGSWWLTTIYAFIGFLLMLLGRSLVAVCFGYGFGSLFLSNLSVELLNLFFALAGLLVLRRIDNMLVDQKQYLIKVTEERDTIKPAEADFQWDGYTELNEDDLQKLKAMDEYDKQVTFNHSSLKALKEACEPDASENGGGDYGDDLDDLSRLDEF